MALRLHNIIKFYGVFYIMINTFICNNEARSISLTKDNRIENSRTIDYTIAKCRQKCFLKTLDNFMFRNDINSPESFQPCRNKPNCFMCYDYCRVLTVAKPDLALSMCSDKLFCTKGCQIACQYHRIKNLNDLMDIFVNDS